MLRGNLFLTDLLKLKPKIILSYFLNKLKYSTSNSLLNEFINLISISYVILYFEL